MKRFLILAVLTVLLAGCSHLPVAASWDKADIALGATFLALKATDYRQTSYGAARPERYREGNPLLGEHPSQEKIDLCFALSSAAELGIAHYLPPKYRKAWLIALSIISGAAVYNNYSIGIGLQW